MAVLDTTAHTIDGSEHVVQLYAREADLVAAVVTYLAGALAAEEVAIVIATDAHLRAFEDALEVGGIALAEARADGRLVVLDAAATMDAVVIDGRVDRGAFHDVIGGLVRRASRSGRTIRAYGEIVALLWDAGNVSAAIELEGLWNELARELPFSLFCAYPAASVSGPEHAHALHEMCGLHSSVFQPPAKEERELTASFPGDRDAPGNARRLTVATLREWGCSKVQVNEAALVLSELASNAVIHGDSAFSVVVCLRGSRLRIAVQDACPFDETEPDGGLLARKQHGLGVVQALSAQWGIDATPDGKVVWAELRENS